MTMILLCLTVAFLNGAFLLQAASPASLTKGSLHSGSQTQRPFPLSTSTPWDQSTRRETTPHDMPKPTSQAGYTSQHTHNGSIIEHPEAQDCDSEMLNYAALNFADKKSTGGKKKTEVTQESVYADVTCIGVE
ncbi:hypothetical protein JZ751_019521 [Albula glossodonta]|uniref:Secreted protein n=1 Tax=Albula glossodonta TaxID=121402 RepID=A0A8T2N436_9TELE|nr:hypothetical protein JZ751_019521 [Albula glossodonta]